MKEILVARKALAETFTSSAVGGAGADRAFSRLGGGGVGDDPGRAGGDDVGVQLAKDVLRPRAVYADDEPVRVQGVQYREALAEELRVPCHLDRDAGRREPLDQPG